MTRSLPHANRLSDAFRLEALRYAGNGKFTEAFGAIKSAEGFLASDTPAETPAILRAVQSATITRADSLISMHHALQPKMAQPGNDAAAKANRALLRTAKFVAATEAAAVPDMNSQEVHAGICAVHARTLVVSALVRIGEAAVTAKPMDSTSIMSELGAAQNLLGTDDHDFYRLALEAGSATLAWEQQEAGRISLPEPVPVEQWPDDQGEYFLAQAMLCGIRTRIQ